jgi:hypothetical protein
MNQRRQLLFPTLSQHRHHLFLLLLLLFLLVVDNMDILLVV